MISRLYFHDPAGAANSGLIADAVTNFGKIGTVIMPFIITLVWTIIDKCSKKADEMIVISAAVIFSITMINNFITISLLTQGGIALAVLLLFMKREDHPNRELKNNEFCCWEAL